MKVKPNPDPIQAWMSEYGPFGSLDVREMVAASQAPSTGRPSLQVFFRCANSYRRVFRNAAGNAYDARCPSCGKVINFRVGEGGTGARVFEINCRG